MSYPTMIGIRSRRLAISVHDKIYSAIESSESPEKSYKHLSSWVPLGSVVDMP